MAFNPSGAAGIPLSMLCGWVTEMAPTQLPEGVSPDNQEMMYLPGSAYSRSCLKKVFTNPFPTGGPSNFTPTVVYGKSLVTTDGDIKNLWFDSNGVMWVEDWTNSPGTYTQLFQSTPGSFCQSITAFGREWIAISDGLHATDIAYSYDGTFLNRVTQDGPGIAPTVSNLILPAVDMASSGNTLTRMNNQVLCATATAHGLKVGYQAQISNVPDSNSTTVNQSRSSGFVTYDHSVWDFNSGQYRSLFNPGTSLLSQFNVTGFGFSIPSAATILGVSISFGAISQAATTGTISQVGLWQSGSLLGTAKTPGSPLAPVPTVESYGSASDLWGASLTPAVVNDPTFGFAVACNLDSIRAFLYAPFTVTVYYTLSGSGTVAEIDTIVINNETFPGLALVTTTGPHGLIPGIDVSIVGVEPNTVASVSAAQWSAGKTTITTATSHGLSPGAVIQLADVATSTTSTTFSFNGTFTVEAVPSPNQLCYYQVPITATDPDVIDATASTGNVTISWPIPDNTPTPTYFEVQSCPTPTTFYVQVTYSDGTWTSGTVGFIWEGIFYVTQVPDSTHFYYYQPGPDGATSAVGTVTPYGQCTPGLHLAQVRFQLQDGTTTKPGPFATFIANGGQYVSVTVPTGPSNVVARIVDFTGAQPDVPGLLPPFFFIATPGQNQGQVVSTSTVINDNTTTSAIFDFSDNTLFGTASEGGAVSVPGNEVANQIVLDGALGFAYWDSRLTTIGQRAAIQELLNMGFDGGADPDSHYPLGWTIAPGLPIQVVPGHVVDAAQFTGPIGSSTLMSQSAYEDCYGNPIADPNITYKIRFYASGNRLGGMDATFHFSLTSASTGFSSVATLLLNNTGWYELELPTATPDSIPTDLLLNIGFDSVPSSSTLYIDDCEIFDANNPYLDTQAFTSYSNNPTGFDGVSGDNGPTEDTRKIMGFTLIRGTPYAVTQDPSGRVHEIIVNPTSEPSGWTWKEVQANCGTLSAFGITHSQADDESASSGEDWSAWPMEGGAGLFDGAQVHKVSQEIQPNWNPGTSNYPWIAPDSGINMAAAQTISALNDPVERMLYFFVPIGSATAPNQVYPLSYRELNSAYAIANSPPVHVSLGGRLVVTDNTRKWTHWIRPLNGAARMYRENTGELTTVFFGGNGQAPGVTAGFGNIYTLDPTKLTDDDYGQIFPFYVTFFGPDTEKAQALGLTSVRILAAYCAVQISGTGTVRYTTLCDSLDNPWSLSTTRALTANPKFPQEFAGNQAQGSRMALKIQSSPVTGTDNGFNLQWIQFYFKKAKLQIRGAAQ